MVLKIFQCLVSKGGLSDYSNIICYTRSNIKSNLYNINTIIFNILGMLLKSSRRDVDKNLFVKGSIDPDKYDEVMKKLYILRKLGGDDYLEYLDKLAGGVRSF